MRVAALYVEPDGPYASMADVDAWPAERDARRYGGPLPVVAHPPCGPWGRYAHRSHESPELARIAVRQVRRFGGVLEHPRDSKLWADQGMPLPGHNADAHGGITIAIRQCDWGHRAEKPTWIYIVGGSRPLVFPPSVPAPPPPPPYRSGRQPRGVLETMSKRERKLTPPALARWLADIASTCQPRQRAEDDSRDAACVDDHCNECGEFERECSC